MAAEAMASGFAIRTICATEEWIATHEVDAISEVYEVSQSELERLSNMRTPNQVWMMVERTDSIGIEMGSSALVLALDRLQDPGNMGTIMRTADWFGIRHIVCSHDTVSCFNPKVVQSSMGAVFRTKVEYVDISQWLASCGMPVYGASLQGKPLSRNGNPLDSNTSAVLLIGNESRGISPEAMEYVTHPILIPNIGGTAESLNASVAAGILMHYFVS